MLQKRMWTVKELRLNLFNEYQELTLKLILELLADAYKSEAELDRYLASLSEEVFAEVIKELQELEKDGKIRLDEKIRLRDHPGLFAIVKDIEQREWRKFVDWAWMGEQVLRESMLHTYSTTLDLTYAMFAKELWRPGLHPPAITYPTVQIRDTYIINNHIEIPWCQDGKIYSERLYGHVANFQAKLSFVLEEGIEKGKGYDWMIKSWRKLTGSTAYDAARLIKTETMAMWSEATKEAYLGMGIQYVEIVNPEPCSEVCSDYVGEVIPLAEAELGDELPPYHPNCMCEYFAFYGEPEEQTLDQED